MTSSNKTPATNEVRPLIYKGEIIRLIVRSILSLSLLAGGIVLLALKIAGWSIIFGLPMVVISTVFIIYTYDDVLNKFLGYHGEDLDDEEGKINK